MEIRSVHNDDISAITQIYGHYVENTTATFEIDAPSAAEMERRVKSLTSGGFPYLVGTVAGRVVGFAYANQYRPRPAYRFTLEDSIYLHPEFTGRGNGTVLLGQLLEVCRGSGTRQMIAVIGDSRNTASIALHRRLQFREAGLLRSVGLKLGRWVDTVLMQRQLISG